MKKQFELLALAALCAATAGADAIPQAPVVTYGLIRDEYGSPLTKTSAATARLVKSDHPQGTVYASCSVGETDFAAMNYRLTLEIDSEGPVRPYAVVKGTSMCVQCLIGGTIKGLTPSPVFTVPANGTAQRLDFSLGTDADADGMPDAWEAWILAMNGLPNNTAAVKAFKPGDDADGDGMTNYEEYLAGTDPFFATDILTITSITRTANGRAAISFTTTPGRTYRLVASERIAPTPNWGPVATAQTETGTLTYETFTGTGRTVTVYVGATGNQKFFRVAAD